MTNISGDARFAAISVASLMAVVAHGATLTAGDASGYPDLTDVPVDIELETDDGEKVAGLQFDLVFDSTAVSVADFQIGPAAANADKELVWSLVESGRARVIISAVNQDPIPDGTVATGLFDIASDAPLDETPLELDEVIMSDPDAEAVPATGVAGSIQIQDEPPSMPAPTGLAVGALGLALVSLGGALFVREKVHAYV